MYLSLFILTKQGEMKMRPYKCKYVHLLLLGMVAIFNINCNSTGVYNAKANPIYDNSETVTFNLIRLNAPFNCKEGSFVQTLESDREFYSDISLKIFRDMDFGDFNLITFEVSYDRGKRGKYRGLDFELRNRDSKTRKIYVTETVTGNVIEMVQEEHYRPNTFLVGEKLVQSYRFHLNNEGKITKFKVSYESDVFDEYTALKCIL